MANAGNFVQLLLADGDAATPGQSLRATVTGAADGTSMGSYQCGGVAVLGGTLPLPPVELAYAHGHVFSAITVTFPVYGAKFPNIRRNGTTPWGTGASNTALYTLNTVGWDDGLGQASLNLSVTGEYDEATLQTISSFTYYFRDYVNPAVPPDNADYSVNIKRAFSGGGAASGFNDRVLHLKYDPDNAAWNPEVTLDPVNVRVNKRAYPGWDTTHEWEAHSDGTYTNVISSTMTSGPNSVFSVWVRYRLRASYGGNGTWTNYGEVAWTDPRPNI